MSFFKKMTATGVLFPDEREALDFIGAILNKYLINEKDYFRFVKDGLILEELVFSLVPFINIPEDHPPELHIKLCIDNIIKDLKLLALQGRLPPEYLFRKKDIMGVENNGKVIKCFLKVRDIFKCKKSESEIKDMTNRLIKTTIGEVNNYRLPKSIYEMFGLPRPKIPPVPLLNEPTNKYNRKALPCPPLDYSVSQIDRLQRCADYLKWFGVNKESIFDPQEMVQSEDYSPITQSILRLKSIYNRSVKSLYVKHN